MGVVGNTATRPQGRAVVGQGASSPGGSVAPAQPAASAPAQTQGARGGARAPGRRSKVSFNDATPQGTRATLQPIDENTAAVFTVKINKFQRRFVEESEHPQPAESSVIELLVVASNNPKCPPGYVASATFTDRYFQDLYFSEVKGFLCGLLNAGPGDIDDNDWNIVFGRIDQFAPEGTKDPIAWAESAEAAQLREQSEGFLGMLVDVTVRWKNRPGKHPITQYAWTPNPEQHPEPAQ